MKNFAFLSLLLIVSCTNSNNSINNNTKIVNSTLDQWHLLATNADIKYFDIIADSGIYIGTAQEEVWTKKEFITFSKPYFDKGKAWDFKPYERNIYFNKDNNIAWFNEKLDTWMGICRGSGILQKDIDGWKIYQYTLSITVPNEKTKEVVSVIDSTKNMTVH